MSEIWVVEITKDDGATWAIVERYGFLSASHAKDIAIGDNKYYSGRPKCSYWSERPARYVRAMDSVMETPMEEPVDACRGTEKAEKKGK